jgi:protein-tyrosine kinase
MEKIAVAIQRAQMHETGRPLATGPATSARFAVPAERTPGRIKYTRTRKMEVAPDVLERHRVASLKEDATAEAFRLLRTQILMSMQKNGWKTLAVTSPNKGAGKSTVALNLAISFSLEMDYTALLVDADLRDPDIRRMLRLRRGRGLADYLNGRAPVEDLLIHPCIGNLVVLAGTEPIKQTSELLRSPMMADAVEEFRERYHDRLIVFDCPPVLTGADTLALSNYIDATILLVEECKTARDDVHRACELLRDTNVIGIVLNKSRELPEVDPITGARPSLMSRMFGRR